MSFLSKLFAPFFGKAPGGSDRYLAIYVFSNRCREPVAGQIDLLNELSLDDENAGGYYVRKVLHTSGKGRCFGEVEVEVWLDAKKKLVRQEVHGGRWLSAGEYTTEVAAAEERDRAAQAEAAAQAAEQAAGQAAQAEAQPSETNNTVKE
jgi:hypothetical protein